MSEMPRDFTPERGGWILFVGGPRDGTYINLPPLRNSLKVKEFTRSGWHDDFGKLTDHTYNMESLWYGRSETKWWIMLDASIRRKEPDLPRILSAERRALDKILPPAESCAVQMKPGPLSLNMKIDGKEVVPLVVNVMGIKIPNPWMFGGFGSV